MVRFQPADRIRDPIHGNIPVSKLEKRLIDTDVMQRLRRIRQVSLSSLVFPGATHTRFSHSLGVMYLAGELADSIGMSDSEYRTVRIAGLLHDIGHGPFSHASGDIAESFGRTHEERSCELIREELAGILPGAIEIGRIEEYIHGDATVNIVAGEIDADRMDYLLRDATFTGIDHGEIEYETIVEFAELAGGELAFNRQAVYSLTSLLTARLYMHLEVNDHRSTRLAEAMLRRVLREYVERNGVEAMMEKDDYSMHAELMEMGGPCETLYQRIQRRDLLKPAYTIQGDSVSEETVSTLATLDPVTCEQEIAEEAGVSIDAVVAVRPAPPSESTLSVTICDNGETKPLADVSAIPRQLTAERVRSARFDVYTNESNEQAVRDAARSVLAVE
ncbi:MAG: HD superfamily phosphohydrolase [halophilic archaeon J07HX5]|nr:MAG: HD superfamily phosphohydrolase [halophilic archaeon J07HX5]